MRTLVILVILAAIAWNAYTSYVSRRAEAELDAAAGAEPSSAADSAGESSRLFAPDEQPEPVQFKCDGRTRCNQMTSCAEAKYFLRNCPGVKMDGPGPNQDGPGDGIPCEGQWCGEN
jgi:hypothetical protein